jgi:hypothetical protein
VDDPPNYNYPHSGQGAEMKVLFYLVIVIPLSFFVLILLVPLALGLFGGTTAILLESITVGAVHFASYFVSEERAGRMRKWLVDNGIGTRHSG